MGSQQTIKPSGLTTIPQNYPSTPTPGKLEILWDANSTSLYHRLSPFADYNTSLIGGFTTQPYYYTYIDESGRGLNSLKKYESRAFPIGSAPIDVIRVSKFLASGNGIIFLGKQFLLQTGNPYNERRIYNPTSPIVAAGMGLALGSIRPERSFDTSAGLLGIARSLIGDAIPNAIFGEPTVNKPSGTAPDALTGGPLVNTGGKGLLRAGDANRGRAHLEKAWVQTGKQNFSFGSVVKNIVTSLFANFIPAVQDGISQKSDEGAYGLMIGGGNPRFDYVGASGTVYNFGQQWVGGSVTIRKTNQYPVQASRIFATYYNDTPQNKEYRSGAGFNGTVTGLKNGEVGYNIKESGDNNKPGYRYGDSIGANIDKNSQYKNSEMMYQYSFYADPAQNFSTKNPESQKTDDKKTKGIDSLSTQENPYDKFTGESSLDTYDGINTPSNLTNLYEVYNSSNFTASVDTKDPESTKTVDNKTSIAHSYSSSYKYGDVKGEVISTREGEFDTNSDIMDQYREYSDPKYVKSGLGFQTKQPDSNKFEKIKQNLTDTLNKIKKASQGLYNVNIMRDDSTVIRSGRAQTYGYDRLFNTVTNETVSPMNYPLGVLQDYRGVTVVDETLINGNRSYKLPTNGTFDAINTLEVLDKDKTINNSKLRGWNKWQPYKDDLVAFFFYDVVNEKYIPFRASIKGLVENGNASWEEIPFIGRADRVYSYGGFNRNVNLNFKIVISSIAELAPTWQRINYLTTLIKPANYTTSTLNINGSSVMNRFMIPPMVMLTLGDLYRDQPVLIQSVTTTIPDDAAWETLNESAENVEGNMEGVWNYLATYIDSPNVLFGQVPREAEISVGLILLEKERAVVGGANFGHAPRTEDYSKDNLNTVPNPGGFSKFQKSLVVNVIKQTPTTVQATATTPAQQEIYVPGKDALVDATDVEKTPVPTTKTLQEQSPPLTPVLVPQTNGPASDFGDRDIPASGPPQVSPTLAPQQIPDTNVMPTAPNERYVPSNFDNPPIP